VRSLTGGDEEMLLESRSMLPAERDTALLARCVVSLAGETPTMGDVSDLCLGDRQALLVGIRRATLGDRIQSTVSCPGDGCAASLDLDLDAASLVLPPYENPQPVYEVSLGGKRIRYRPVTGKDQEAAARASSLGIRAGVDVLLARCVEGEMPEDLRQRAAELLAEVDPQAEILLDVRCSECGGRFSVLFDAGSFLAREVASGPDTLLREVHALARAYHWSEREILAMSTPRRRRYLELIVETGVFA
jgi:hypothetical protein